MSTDPDDSEARLDEERRVAREKGEPWAEEIEFPQLWSVPPEPIVVTDGGDTILVCHSPGRSTLRFTFRHCQSIRFGSPNDEVLRGHPLWGHGLSYYGAHIVHESPWAAEIDAINSVHAQYRGPRDVTHYLFAFQDDTFEALAASVEFESIPDSYADAIRQGLGRILRDH